MPVRVPACNDPDDPCPYFYHDGNTQHRARCRRRSPNVLFTSAAGCGEHPTSVAEREEAIGAARERGRLSEKEAWRVTSVGDVMEIEPLTHPQWRTGDPPEDGQYITYRTVVAGAYMLEMTYWQSGRWLDAKGPVTHWMPLPEGPG